MEAIVTTGLVLREVKYQDADRILTILTPEHGIISAFAKGSLRLKSKLFSACGLFCYSEFRLFPGKEMFRIDEADVKNIFHGLSSTLEGMSLAIYLAELTTAVSPTGSEGDKLLRLLLNSLYLLSEKKCPALKVKAVFELRAMSECGFMPQLLCCKECNKYDGENFYLEHKNGVLFCEQCATKNGNLTNLNEGALFALRHICLVEDKKVFAFQISEKAMHYLSLAAQEYTLLHLDKKIKSLDFLKSVL